MISTNCNINFTRTFKPEKKYVSILLEIANDIDRLTIQDISLLTGIPTGKSSGKVEPTIYYANYMGLIDYSKNQGRYSIKRTNIGEKVYQEDPGLLEKITLLLCHGMICRNIKGAAMWNFGFAEMFPKYHGKISRVNAINEMNSHFGNVTSKNFAPFIESYNDFFSPLKILDVGEKEIVCKKHFISKEDLYVLGFLFLTFVDEIFPGRNEISSNEILESKFANVIGLDQEEEFELLERFSEAGIIRINKQLFPYTCLKLVDSEDLISDLYSELC